MATPFRERNPIPIAVAGVAVLLVGLIVAFQIGNIINLFNGSRTVVAYFADASGLNKNDDVDIAGIKVGQVQSISLAGDRVRIAFSDNAGIPLGRQARADIKIKTLLGQEYIDLQPAGPGDLTGAIPVSRTTTPLIVTEAFSKLGAEEGQINTQQLAKAFDTLAQAFAGTPPYVRANLQGLSRLSNVIASRDQQLSELFLHAQSVTGVLAAHNAQVTKLLTDGDLVLQLVEQQRTVIQQLLSNTAALAQQLTALVQENRQAIGPALANLNSVLVILEKHRADLDSAIHELAPFVRDFDNTLGNGHFFDNFIADLPPGEFPVSVQGTPGVSAGGGGK